MDSVANSMKSAASAVTKGATSTASKVTKGATSTASKVTKGATSAVNKTTSAVSKTSSAVTKGATNAMTKTTTAMSEAFKKEPSSRKMGNTNSVRGAQIEPKANNMLGGLMDHNVTAVVKDVDHYRKHGLMVVETDYIIHVKCLTDESDKDFGFIISKTFSSFRTLANELYGEAEDVMFSSANLPKKITQLAKCCHAVLQLVESQGVDYLGKVNFTHVQTMSKQRSQIINDFLEAILTNFPERATIERQPFARKFAIRVEKFFLTDHCENVGGEGEEDIFGTIVGQKIPKNYHSIDRSEHTEQSEQVVEVTKKERASKESRITEEKELSRASLQMAEQQQAQSKAPAKKVSPVIKGATFLDEKPLLALAIFAGAMQVLRALGCPAVTVNLDVIFSLTFAALVVGMHAPKVLGLQGKGGSAGGSNATAQLMQKAMSVRGADGAIAEEEENFTFESPMPQFPEGAKLGSILNCWSSPPATNFKVRGDNYLSDKKKIQSGPYLFQNRGVDLFLTELCPENVGRISSLIGGEIRSVPTFIINFRLPWGVLLFYYEIPDRFVPYIKSCYGDGMEKANLEASLKELSPAERCCARFLLGDDEHKNKTLKIFPVIVEGPWVVKASVGGKPAIIGNKLPVNYVYEPEGTAADGSFQALYLEADLDIVSSSAARGILSMCRSCTQELTIDLGFGVQGNAEDELPEQMLTGCRIHGIDPLNAPPLPPFKDTILAATQVVATEDETDSDED